MFHRVCSLWMIETREQYKFVVDEHFIEWYKGGPWFNHTIFQNLSGPIFEEIFVILCQYRYNVIFGLCA